APSTALATRLWTFSTDPLNPFVGLNGGGVSAYMSSLSVPDYDPCLSVLGIECGDAIAIRVYQSTSPLTANITEVQAMILGAGAPTVISFLPSSGYVSPGRSGVGGAGADPNAGRWYFGVVPGFANELHSGAISAYLLLAFPDGAIANSEQEL